MRIGIIATVAAAVSLAGCGQSVQRPSDAATPSRPGDCIETRCVAAYQQENAPYWTDQHQRFCPSSVLLEAWGTEPEGAYSVAFRNGQFSKTGLNGASMKALPAGLMNAALAELVYYSFTAGAGFEPTKMTAIDPARIEGQRYEAFELANAGADRTVTLYKNADTGLIELVQIAEAKGCRWMARSYNPRYQDRLQRMIPRKIDIFDIQQGLSAKKLLIQFDYIEVQ